LASGLKKLPDGKREIFNLKTVQKLSNQEIADRLNISIHTVKSQYYHASKFIKEYLDKHADIQMHARESG
jgi:RNA polymerase sigma-70 factor (ECF subfamily)